MPRRTFAIVAAASVFAIASCTDTDHGSYQVSWVFEGDEPAGVGCGLHGVGAIRVTGVTDQGGSHETTTPCASGQLTHAVPVGTWAFTIRPLDPQGVWAGWNGPDPVARGVIVKDTITDLDPPRVVLTPRPACADGVDNDGDGRIDRGDPECQGDPTDGSEAI
jgi:hypothetical protein